MLNHKAQNTLRFEFKTYICSLELLLLLVQSALDDVSSREQSLLQTPESLVLHLHGDVVVKDLVVVLDAQLLQGWRQVVSLLVGSGVIFVLLLALLHLVTGLHEDGLFKDALEDVFLVVLLALLVDGCLTLLSVADLCVHVSLLLLDLIVASHLDGVDLLEDLLLL